jgi:hypothetical protein
MMAYTNHGKTSPAKKNSGRKPKLSERNSRTLKRSVSNNHRTTAAKVTAELSIHLKDPVSITTVARKLQKSNIQATATIDKPLVTENNAKRPKRWCDDHKTWTADDWMMSRPSRCSQHQAGFMFGEHPRKPINLNAWFQL